jgi:hypothetical protein
MTDQQQRRTTMRPQRTSPSRLGRRALLALAAVAAFTAAGTLATPAEACGMRAFYSVPKRPDPDALLATARKALDENRAISATLVAKQVLDIKSATDEQRAEAWSIIGWVRWTRGQRATAVEAMNKSRELDDHALEAVLLLFADAKSAQEVHKALGA